MGGKVIGCSVCILGLVVVLGVIAGPVNAIPCQNALVKLLPCEPFLVGSAESVSVPCCQSVEALNQIATSKPERQSLCECFKKAAPAMGVKVDRAKELPDLCKVQVPVAIDPNINCNK
ncbi:unnamed protein product [Ilex paraguariensis]|uniref:Non-specific lipid-transfer protein n=1 Tax=Ilex paraguariensis TaxID=185542 RepID=A0ABC8UL13_9AQUA